MFNRNKVRRIQYYNGSILIVRSFNRKLYYEKEITGRSLLRLNRVLRNSFVQKDFVIGRGGVTLIFYPKES